ncbi:MAG: amidohydrolase family protein [Terrimonas sp.]|nr:amidohydrolase family protein [Terrimonas sp.]OJY98038.1 MAG: amidohydrolase [Sphingobacteriales bacterium 40-81]
MTVTRFFSLLLLLGSTQATFSQNLDSLLLKNYRPRSVYKIPVSKIEKAKFPVIDMHSHNSYAKSVDEIKAWIGLMDQYGIDKVVILTQSTGARFDSIYKVYSPYLNRFELWCGFDYTGYQEPGWGAVAVKELERCVKVGARGVGELGDKGLGEVFSEPVPGYGMHPDDQRLQPLYQKCAELKIPVSIHVADPIWMYEPMDSTNDGLMNGYKWRLDKHKTKPGFRGHEEMIKTLENVVRSNPKTTFIACHLANSENDFSVLGRLLSTYSNLYTDLGAHLAEIATIPRAAAAFLEKYGDKVVYGTDYHPTKIEYEITFRILQTADEHFYATEHFGYHWPLHGLNLSDSTLKKIYGGNALKILKK